MSIRVVSKHWYVAKPGTTSWYIGRGSVLGNRATSVQGRATLAEVSCASVAESIAWYADWLAAQLSAKNPVICAELNRLYLAAKQGDVALVCFCKLRPGSTKSEKPCHGDVLKELIETKLNPTKTDGI